MSKRLLVELTKRFVEIRTENPPGNELVFAKEISTLLKSWGIEAHVDVFQENRANVWATIEGSTGSTNKRPKLLFYGHMDTVPAGEGWKFDPFLAKSSNGAIYGLGTTDMKGALAAILCAAQDLAHHRERLRGELILLFVSDEERKNEGIKHFLCSFKRGIDFAVICEPTNLNFAIRHRGAMRILITTFGVSKHSGNPYGGVNAVYKMVNLINELNSSGQLRGSLSPQLDFADLSKIATLEVTKIEGGHAENAIPEKCQILLDRRLTSEEDPEEALKALTQVLESAKIKDPDLIYDLQLQSVTPPWKVQEKSKLILLCQKVYRDCFKTKANFVPFNATTEAGYFGSKGIDTVVFGPGDLSDAHCPNEHVEIRQLEMAYLFYFNLAKEILL